MAESSFIRTVAFGGYNKTDVSKRMEYLYSQFYEMKNDIRESKLLLEEYKKGTPEEKAHESVLTSERAKLTMTQVQNESLSEKLKQAKDELQTKDNDIAALKAENDSLKSKLEDALSELASYKAINDPSALSKVFIEAQKSADMLIADAKKEKENMQADTKSVVENIIDEANNDAMRIVYEAEKNAAEIEASLKSESEKIKASSNNMRAVMLNDVKALSEDFTRIKELFEAFEKETISSIEKSKKLISDTETKLTSGGTPVFTDPEAVVPKFPDVPSYKKIDYTSPSEKKSRKEADDDLKKLLEMANSIEIEDEGDTPTADAAPEGDDKAMDLDALTKLANSLVDA